MTDRTTLARAAIDAAIEAIADRVANKLAEKQQAPEWVPLNSCGLPARTVRRAARRGELRMHRVGRADFVNRVELDAWMARQDRPLQRATCAIVGDDDGLAELLADPALEARQL